MKYVIISGIFGVSLGAVQFVVYEELKNRYNQNRQQVGSNFAADFYPISV